MLENCSFLDSPVCMTLTKVFHLALELYGVAHFGAVDLRPAAELRGQRRRGGSRLAPLRAGGEAICDVTCKCEENVGRDH